MYLDFLRITLWLVILVYNYFVLEFSISIFSKVIDRAKLYSLILSIFTSTVLTIFAQFNLGIILFLLLHYSLIYISYIILSKGSVKQIFFGAGILTLHYTAGFLSVLIFNLFFFNESLTNIYLNQSILYQFKISAYIVLLIILVIFIRTINISGFKKLSDTHIYSQTISTISFISTLFLISEFMMKSYESLSITRLIQSYSTGLLILFVFYFFFLYSLKLVSLHVLMKNQLQYSDIINPDIITTLHSNTIIKNTRSMETVKHYISSIENRYTIFYMRLAGYHYIIDTFGKVAAKNYLQVVTMVLKSATKSNNNILYEIKNNELIFFVDESDPDKAKELYNNIFSKLYYANKRMPFLIYSYIGYFTQTNDDYSLEDSINKARLLMLNKRNDIQTLMEATK